MEVRQFCCIRHLADYGEKAEAAGGRVLRYGLTPPPEGLPLAEGMTMLSIILEHPDQGEITCWTVLRNDAENKAALALAAGVMSEALAIAVFEAFKGPGAVELEADHAWIPEALEL